MANVLTTNPMVLDTAGATSLCGRLKISSIIVNASSDTWSCVIHDKVGGNIIFQADSALVNHRSVYWSPAAPVSVAGLYWTTDTNIGTVLVYLA